MIYGLGLVPSWLVLSLLRNHENKLFIKCWFFTISTFMLIPEWGLHELWSWGGWINGKVSHTEYGMQEFLFWNWCLATIKAIQLRTLPIFFISDNEILPNYKKHAWLGVGKIMCVRKFVLWEGKLWNISWMNVNKQICSDVKLVSMHLKFKSWRNRAQRWIDEERVEKWGKRRIWASSWMQGWVNSAARYFRRSNVNLMKSGETVNPAKLAICF